MKKVWVFSSETDRNAKIGINRKKWGYNKSAKSHGGIEVGDYVLIYSKESKKILCVATVRTPPKIGDHIYFKAPSLTYLVWDWFSLDIKKKINVPLESLKRKFSIDNATKFCRLYLPNSPSQLTARQALQITKMKG